MLLIYALIFALGFLLGGIVHHWFTGIGLRAMERDGELIVRRRRPD